MKPFHEPAARNAWTRTAVKLFLFFGLVTFPACSLLPGSNAMPPATATALQEKVVLRATQMGQNLRQTEAAEDALAKATAQARSDLIETGRSWPARISDSFDNNDLNWQVGEESGDLTDIRWEISGGQYRWQATAKDSFVYWINPDMDPVANFHAAVDVKFEGDPESAEAGLAFRIQDEDHYYIFDISPDGWYSCYNLDVDTWEALIPWTQSFEVYSSQPNRIDVYGTGSHFIFSINGTYVAEVEDSRVSSGAVGVVAGLSNVGDTGSFRFDNFTVQSP